LIVGVIVTLCVNLIAARWLGDYGDERMCSVEKRSTVFFLAAICIAAGAILAWRAHARSPSNAASTTQTAISGDANAGAELFDSVCEECHGAAATAPTLRGIIGRPAASVESFDGYSDALRAKKSLIWTPENLNLFLKSPKDFVPGTLMYKTVPDEKDRADIIAYLASLPPPRK
jgi:cytochrome c